MHPDGKAHGGTVLIMRSDIMKSVSTKKNSCRLLASWSKIGMAILLFKPYTYYLSMLCYKKIMSNIHAGDRDWSYPKGGELFKLIEDVNLTILSTRGSTYWPSENKKIPDLLNFDIIKDISKDFYRTVSYLELSSDHSPVIFRINSKIMIKGKSCTLYSAKTKWHYF